MLRIVSSNPDREMPLHPQAQALLDMLATLPQPDYATLTAPAFRAGIAMSPAFAPGDAVARVDDLHIAGPGGELALRVYHPQATGELPVTLYFHGGGFVACGLDTHDNICRCLAQRAGSLVISVDYRLAPEAPFPAAVDDACAALAWVRQHAQELGGDPARISVAGDSAGGNLAAVAAHHAWTQGWELSQQLLLYPVTDCARATASFREHAANAMLSAAQMDWFGRLYLPDAALALDPRASPLRQTELAGLADATIITAEFDPLRDEGEAYAEALQAAGVAVKLRRWPGQIHGFASMLGMFDDADLVLTHAANALRKAFERDGAAA